MFGFGFGFGFGRDADPGQDAGSGLEPREPREPLERAEHAGREQTARQLPPARVTGDGPEQIVGRTGSLQSGVAASESLRSAPSLVPPARSTVRSGSLRHSHASGRNAAVAPIPGRWFRPLVRADLSDSPDGPCRSS
ncbi:hypothetical protein D8M35_14900 [Curtobacterium sp. HSID17257]|nr:hypothetical protein D8M35_14900 [Curtobacterium sp. HSID17257]